MFLSPAPQFSETKFYEKCCCSSRNKLVETISLERIQAWDKGLEAETDSKYFQNKCKEELREQRTWM